VTERSSHDAEQERVVVRDRRRIDPLTGEVRVPEADAAAQVADPGPGLSVEEGLDIAPDSVDDKLAHLSAQLDERIADLQRVSAEYANYRKRVDRDRDAVAVAARAQLVGQLLPVLDDLDRARAHGDLTGVFKAVADKLVATLKQVELEPFGVEGEPFDPSVHEAVAHTISSEVSGPTVSAVMRQGYRIGERVLRPAIVEVSDRDTSAEAPQLPDPVGGMSGFADTGSQTAGERDQNEQRS